MKKGKSILSILLVLAMAFSLFACAKKADGGGATPAPDAPATSAPSGGDEPSTPVNSDEYVTLTIGVSQYLGRFLTGLTPADNASACDAVFEAVFKINPKTKEIYSDILEEWHWEDDTTLVLKMIDGVYFSNGKKATSEDLLFAYLQHTQRGSQFGKNMLLVEDECIIRDEFTVQIKVQRKDQGVFITEMHLYDKEWAEQVGWDSEEWYTPVGSGPYECVEYVNDDHMILKLRDSYWKRSIDDYYIDEYYIRYYPDSTTMYMALERGDIDLCTVGATDYDRFVASGGEGFNVIPKSKGVTYNFLFGWQETPVWKDNLALRQAVAYGINWEELGAITNGGLYVPANSITPASGPMYYDVGHHEYDVEKAKQLLAEAGYAPGELTLRSHMSDAQSSKTYGEAVKFYLDKIGINADITYSDSTSMLASWTTPGDGNDFQQHFNVKGSPTFNPTTSIALSPVKEGITFGYVDDDHFQELFKKVSTSFDNPDTAYRKEVARELQQYIFDNVLIIPFAEYVYAIGYNTDVLTEQQINDFVLTDINFQLSKLGLK
jgi:peptide/nickel transport system substrate-binding protein